MQKMKQPKIYECINNTIVVDDYKKHS